MTREQLKAIRDHVEAATPGPWEAGTAFCCPDCGWVDGPKRTVCPVYEGTKRTHTLDANDAEFIAHAREDVPALLMEVERLQTDVDLLKSLKHGWKVLTEKAIGERDAAFKRGVAAMREAAAQHLEYPRGGGMLETRYLRLASEIRALPDPEDAS